MLLLLVSGALIVMKRLVKHKALLSQAGFVKVIWLPEEFRFVGGTGRTLVPNCRSQLQLFRTAVMKASCSVPALLLASSNTGDLGCNIKFEPKPRQKKQQGQRPHI